MTDQFNIEAQHEAHEGAMTKGPTARNYFTIGEMAREFGFTLRALRFYEEKGLVSPRRNGNRRLYSQADRSRLEVIADAKRIGMPLEDIRAILEAGKAGGDDVPMLRVALEKTVNRLDALEEEKATAEGQTREALRLIDSLNTRLGNKAPVAAG